MDDTFPKLETLKKLLKISHKITLDFMSWRIENNHDGDCLDIELARLAVCLETASKKIHVKFELPNISRQA